MKPLSVQEIRDAVHGRLLASHPTRQPVVAVCTDTRRMDPSCLYIAIKGDNFDGHHFLPAAAAGGAIAALVQDAPPDALPNVTMIQVPDTRAAMGKLATHVRRQMRAKVIGVAGSNGKTSTKHLIDAALCDPLRGSISPKSYNNDIGVPLSIFPADPHDDYLVLEIGTNHPGEVRNLSRIALPDIAVITNCSAEHLEGLIDLEGVRRENASLIEGLAPGGLLLVNGDDPELLKAIEAFKGRRITFGFAEHNHLRATHIVCDDTGVRFRVNRIEEPAFVPLLGKHSAANALASIAIGRELGLSDHQILANLRQAKPAEMRLILETCGEVRLLNDAYNANPASVKAALEMLAGLPAGRRVAVVGEMRELGAASESLHREIGRFIAKNFPPDLLICVGPMGETIAAEARLNGLNGDRVEYFPDAAAACAVTRRLRRGDLVLLKGSRAVRLETVARAIQAENVSPGSRTS
jgi:UDP-N-acetylmuramoyl-tripeptide--D-alanyl-D-alanine ligase